VRFRQSPASAGDCRTHLAIQKRHAVRWVHAGIDAREHLAVHLGVAGDLRIDENVAVAVRAVARLHDRPNSADGLQLAAIEVGRIRSSSS